MEESTTFVEKKQSFMGKASFLGQFLRYFVTGGVATVADFAFFALAFYVFGLHYLVANVVALLAGGTVNYFMSFGWVFSSEKRRIEKSKGLELLVFVSICLIGMLFNEGLMYLFVGLFALQEILAKCAATVIVFMWNFLARKFILFRKQKKV